MPVLTKASPTLTTLDWPCALPKRSVAGWTRESGSPERTCCNTWNSLRGGSRILPLIESLERALKKRFLCISYLGEENDALPEDNQKMKQVLKNIRSKVRDLRTMM